MDRFIFSEEPYTRVLGRKRQFTDKQWHNIILLALAMNPFILLCTHKPSRDRYNKEQYLSYEKWDLCLEYYRRFFKTNHITYTEYDYNENLKPSVFEVIEAKYRAKSRWWVPMWQEGIGMIGSQTPKFLIVAQEIGPNNVNNLPFETGPTGYMMSEMLTKVGVPLGDIAITNIAKVPRGTRRPVNNRDKELFEQELTNLKPQKVIFMGALSREGISIAKSLKIDYGEMPHLGWFRRVGRDDYCNVFRSIIGSTKSVWEA